MVFWVCAMLVLLSLQACILYRLLSVWVVDVACFVTISYYGTVNLE